MDLALGTGRGPDILADIEGLRPLVRDADVAVLGPRDAEQAREYGSQPLPPTIFAQDLQELRRVGADEAARAAIEHLCRPELDGFWIHLDVDVLDDAIMPAVGYRMPDGLSLAGTRDDPQRRHAQRPRARHQHHDLRAEAG